MSADLGDNTPPDLPDSGGDLTGSSPETLETTESGPSRRDEISSLNGTVESDEDPDPPDQDATPDADEPAEPAPPGERLDHAASQADEIASRQADLESGDDNTTAYRVEGMVNERLDIDPAGDVSIKGDTALFLNFGDEARAESFLARRMEQDADGGWVVKTFEVPESYVDDLRASAVPESQAGAFPDRPFLVDTTVAEDQFGIRSNDFEDLSRNIIPGSGRVRDDTTG